MTLGPLGRIVILALCAGLAACGQSTSEAEVERALQGVNVIDESNMNDVMLRASDPAEAVSYFQRASAANPDRLDLRRGLGLALIRAGKGREAVAVMTQVTADPDATDADRVTLAGALIRAGDWDRADEVLDAIPPTYETFERYRYEAMVADSNEEWAKSDAFYETALGLTTRPSGVLNNWGYSKLSRGEYDEAERLFGEALSYDPDLFTSKNNLALARAAQRNYDLPVVRMTQVERAQLLHTMGLAAIKQGDTTTGKGLLRQALDTHPQYFEAAARSLDALDAGVAN